jgi:hypothetical protein
LVRYISENDDDFLTVQESTPTAHLSLLVAGRISHSFPLRGEVLLGREKGNTIVVADQKVSRHHATLKPIDDRYVIYDQGSANGTYVNGVQIAQPTRLRHQDKITLGDTTFLFTSSRPDPTTIERIEPGAAALGPASPPVTTPQPFLAGDNRPVWLVIGCMAVAIIALLIILALMFGLFLGRGQMGLALWWLASGGW